MRLFILNLLLLSGSLCQAKFDPKFRMDKVNFVWSKAVAHIKDQEVVTKLQEDLAHFDILYLTIKQDTEHHKKAKNTNEVDRKLERLLERYGLEKTIQAFQMKYKNDEKKLESEQKPTTEKLSDNFEDERVLALWNSIKDAPDFTNDDLNGIHRQFVRQDKRCRDYKDLLAHHKQTSDNHVHTDEEHEETAKKVKQLNQEIEANLEELRNRINEIQYNPFKNVKVRQLWDKAQQSKGRLIANELDVIKTELRHLDRQWDKTEYHAEHLATHEDHLKSMGHDGGDEDSQKLREYQEKLQRKLKKLEAYLEDKVTRHSEL